jgi:hypothetical protein
MFAKNRRSAAMKFANMAKPWIIARRIAHHPAKKKAKNAKPARLEVQRAAATIALARSQGFALQKIFAAMAFANSPAKMPAFVRKTAGTMLRLTANPNVMPLAENGILSGAGIACFQPSRSA